MFLRSRQAIGGPRRCATLQVNGRDTPDVPSLDRDGEAVTLRCRRPNHPAPQPLERGAWRRNLVVRFRLRYRRSRKHARIKITRTSSHGCRADWIVRSRAERRRLHIYPRRPRLRAVFRRAGFWRLAAPISRRKACRINSEKLISSRNALARRSWWSSRGRRNVTGTLPLSSFVLGMSHVYDCLIHIVKIEFSCSVIFAMTRSAACETRNPPLLRSPFLWPLTGPCRRSPIKNIVEISQPRSGRSFIKKRECRASSCA